MENRLANFDHLKQDQNLIYTCEFCGNPNKTHDFKGKKICEDCLRYIKDC